MPKRKRGTEETGAHLTQELSARPPLRKSARLLERESHQLSSVRKGKKQRRGNKRCRALASPSTTGSTREDRHSTQLFENNTEKSTNDTSFESHFGKTHSAPFGLGAGNKRKHEEELSPADTESRKRLRKSESTAVSPNLDPKERLELLRDGLSKNPKVQFEEAVAKTSVPVIKSPDKPAKELGAREIEQKESHNPISYWATHHTWPKNFAEDNLMVSVNSINKRQRTSDYFQSGKDERSRSYSQSRKNGEAPEQYTAAYERHILTKGLDMDPLKGEELVSEESKNLCINLQQITHNTIKPTIFPIGVIRKVINFCRNRNEAIVNRDVTPMIIPPIASLYFNGDSNLEHVVDEVNADWYSQCVLEGPQLRPDLAIGLFSSAFTEEENEKLKRYNSVNNWTSVTMHMFFPFLMCEVKCGREGLDIADRQNMHSCSVAVRALLRIEQEADKYRSEKKMDSLNGQVLVFSISHDQSDARLYAHFAVVQGEKWTYCRYPIQKFDLTKKDSLLAIHNFVRNILKSYLPGHVQQLKDALRALPDPNKPPESSGLPGSSGLSFAASEISLNDDNSQHDSQDRDADGFVVPPRPDSSQNGRTKKKGRESAATSQASMQSQLDSYIKITGKMQGQLDKLMQQEDKLMQQLDEEREENRKHKREMDESSDAVRMLESYGGIEAFTQLTLSSIFSRFLACETYLFGTRQVLGQWSSFKSDSGATMDEERQLHPSVQGDSIASPSGKRSRSLSGSGRADGRGSDWVFDVFAESDSRTEGDGSPSSKRARTSSRPTEAAKNRPPPTAAVKGVQMPGTAQADRSPQGDQEYKVHQVVGESGSEYEVTALTKMWLPKASVDPKLVRKSRSERRAATRVRTRWSSRLQNKN